MKERIMVVLILSLILIMTGCSQDESQDEAEKIVIKNQGDKGAFAILELSKSEDGEYRFDDWYDIFYMEIYQDGSKKIVSASGEEVRTTMDYHLAYYYSPEQRQELIEKYNLDE